MNINEEIKILNDKAKALNNQRQQAMGAKAIAEDGDAGLPRQLPLKEFQKWLGKCKAKDTSIQEKKKVITIK